MAPDRLDDEEFRTSFLQLVGGEVARIKRLIDDLLMFARAPTQQVAVININEVVDRAITLLRPEARQARVELIEHSDAELPVVLGDFDQMLQVLINIVLNAIQATATGGRVSVETRCTVDEGGHCCRVDVSDNGAGIPDQLRESVFNPFFTTKDKGTGLGLAIANRIVTEAGGFIAVDSRQGDGTRFSIILPAARVQASRVNQSGAEQDIPVSEAADALPHRA
jgi:signal transduction histidine kinase